MKILVTGATGTVGGEVVAALATSEADVCVLVRDPSKYDAPSGVTVVRGDLTDPADVRTALDGVDRVFLNMADDNGATFAQVAGEVGVDHVVLLSSFTVEADLVNGADNIITARHRSGEQALSDAGIASTFLRPTGFDYNVTMFTSDVANGVVRAPYLDVKLPVIDPADIGACAAAVLTSRSPLGGAHLITGPELLSVRDQTAVIAQVLGKELAVEQVPEDAAKAAAFPEGTPPIVVDSVFGTFDARAATATGVTDGVAKILGRPARTFTQWAEAHKQAFA